MKLTTRGRYAVMAMLDIAQHQGSPISLGVISKRQGISLSYLEQIFSKLRKADLVVSSRGPGGGYCLKRDVSKIYMNEIIGAVNEDIDPRLCKGKTPCNGVSECASHALWDNLREVIEGFLSSVSIQSIIKQGSNDSKTFSFNNINVENKNRV